MTTKELGFEFIFKIRPERFRLNIQAFGKLFMANFESMTCLQRKKVCLALQIKMVAAWPYNKFMAYDLALRDILGQYVLPRDFSVTYFALYARQRDGRRTDLGAKMYASRFAVRQPQNV